MLLSEFINLKEKPGCNMTEEGRACAVHGINECPGYKMIETSAQDKLYQRHQELRKKSGLPNPNYYKELKKTFDLPDEERHVAVAALKRKYKIDEAGPFSYGAKKPRKGSVADLAAKKRKEQEKGKQPVEPRDHMVGVARVKKDVEEAKHFRTAYGWAGGRNEKTGKTYKHPEQIKADKEKKQGISKDKEPKKQGVAEGVEQYLEELSRAGYEVITETAELCPECGGPAFADRMLAEKQDACYHKVKSRYKVWPSAYASGALVRCRKKGAKNWGNKSKK